MIEPALHHVGFPRTRYLDHLNLAVVGPGLVRLEGAGKDIRVRPPYISRPPPPLKQVDARGTHVTLTRLLAGAVVCRPVKLVGLPRRRRRRQGLALDAGALLAGIATTGSDNLVFARTRRFFAGFEVASHEETPCLQTIFRLTDINMRFTLCTKIIFCKPWPWEGMECLEIA